MSDLALEERLSKELNSFQDLWEGGYYKGDPLDSMFSLYSIFGYMSTYHVIYLTCIKPYVNENTCALEIGSGRGAWTKTYLHAKEIWCLDALSAEHNKFWEYVGRTDKIKYFQVDDFSCRMLPDDTFDYLFSYDALCHVSFDGITAYARNIFPKLKDGAHCFLMVADYAKYNSWIDNRDRLSVLGRAFPKDRTRLLQLPLDKLATYVNKLYSRKRGFHKFDMEENQEPSPGRWYHAGKDRTCAMLKDVGYKIIDADVGADYRSPIIHFSK